MPHRQLPRIVTWARVLPALLLAVLATALGARPAGAQHAWRFLDAPASAPGDVEVGAVSFLRVHAEPNESVGLQIAARRYRASDPTRPELLVVGVAHIGDAAYYRAIQDLLGECDVVLYESVKPTGTGGPPPGEAPETDEQRAGRTRAALGFLSSVVEMHRLRVGRYPDDLDELHMFAREHEARLGQFVEQTLRDAWGRRVVYALDPRGDGTPPFTLSSLGADGRRGGRGMDADLSPEGAGVVAPHASASEDNLQSQLAAALGLEFQLEVLDYGAPNWRCSDMSMDQLQQAMAERGANFSVVESTLAGTSLPAMLAKFMLQLIRVADAFTDGAMSDKLKILLIELLGDEAAMSVSLNQFDAGFAEVIIGERNQVVVDDLRRLIDGEPEVRSVGILYGAGHMQDLSERLSSLGYRPGAAQWLTAIEVDLRTSPVSEMEMRRMRLMVQRMMKQMRQMYE